MGAGGRPHSRWWLAARSGLVTRCRRRNLSRRPKPAARPPEMQRDTSAILRRHLRDLSSLHACAPARHATPPRPRPSATSSSMPGSVMPDRARHRVVRVSTPGLSHSRISLINRCRNVAASAQPACRGWRVLAARCIKVALWPSLQRCQPRSPMHPSARRTAACLSVMRPKNVLNLKNASLPSAYPAQQSWQSQGQALAAATVVAQGCCRRGPDLRALKLHAARVWTRSILWSTTSTAVQLSRVGTSTTGKAASLLTGFI